MTQEEIKACHDRALEDVKGWLAEYDRTRSPEAIRMVLHWAHQVARMAPVEA